CDVDEVQLSLKLYSSIILYRPSISSPTLGAPRQRLEQIMMHLRKLLASVSNHRAATSITRGFQTSTMSMAGQKTRLSRGQGRSGNDYGPLTDSPDWSYVENGEPAPITKAQQRRRLKANLHVHRIDSLLAEITSARK
ncbi:hypothetical protein SARC_00781, partial [Sphaeroforma arctica JP610]